MNRNLVILAGGISSRMKKPSKAIDQIDSKLIQDADEKTKAMIGVGLESRPFLDYLLFNAEKAGYVDIVIVIGENDSSIREYYQRWNSFNNIYGLKISFAEQKIPAGRTRPLGTADALLTALEARKDWQGQKFTVCNSDNLYSIPALKIMLASEYRNAMINYNSTGFQFEKSRVEHFAIVITDAIGFLLDIIEKPSPELIESAKDQKGGIGTSMNIFMLDYDMIYPYLKAVPLHPVRLEKELPEAVKLMVKDNPKSLFAYPLCEHVPDLTNKDDIIPVKKYLEQNYPDSSYFRNEFE